ncbi:hypothetical protein M433DRAFT_136621 [Acidomyces richmondensis BFW]|nr:hypothetical protein M433DRAFT_136621 [Acidomyces richmondensis BFW]
MAKALLLLGTVWLWAACGDAAGTGGRMYSEEGGPYLILPPGRSSEDGVPSRDLGEMEFTLRHIYHHGSHQYPHLHRYLDVPPSASSSSPNTPALLVRAQTIPILRLSSRRPEDIDALLSHAHVHGTPAALPPSSWLVDSSTAAPNTSDKDTILTFAKMAADAYVQDHDGSGWKDVKGGFNYTDDFGWEADGLRGHIFADQKNRTIVIGLKGTSPALFDGADTTGNDKLNDNLFGSCCCGQGGQYLWKQVCNCMSEAYTCNSTCLVRSLRERGHYYRSVRELYHNVTARYPDVTDVWLSGHSLGGVVASLLGLTYGLPTLTFEAFPDALAAKRLGLPVPPGYKIGSADGEEGSPERGIFHFGHTADPVYMGMCNGASSMCTIGGYAFQSACHTGRRCVYDTVGDLGWRVGIGTHKIDSVIKDVLERYDRVPGCKVDTECVDCYAWKFFESNGTEPPRGGTTSSSSITTSTQTRTETCKTPGWWGCLDETTTSEELSTTTTTTTTTCKTPGWFGCKDPTTTISSTSTSSSLNPAHSLTRPAPTQASSTSTCQTPGWFGCRDATPSSTSPAPSTPSPTNLPSTRRKGSELTCVERHWYGMCQEWRTAEIGWKDL